MPRSPNNRRTTAETSAKRVDVCPHTPPSAQAFLLRRSLLVYTRDYSSYAVRVLMYLVMAISVGTVFWQLTLTQALIYTSRLCMHANMYP